MTARRGPQVQAAEEAEEAEAIDGEVYVSFPAEEGPGTVLQGVVHGMVDSFLEDLTRPEFRAGFAASVVAALVASKTRMGFIPSLVFSLAVGAATEKLTKVTIDVHEAAVAQRDYLAALPVAGDAPSEV